MSISEFIVHFEMFENLCAIISRFFFSVVFWMYVSRHLTEPLSGIFVGSGHMSLL